MDFYHLLQTIHHIPGVDMLLGYADIQGDLLPINNDENFHKAVSSASPLLRIIITKKGKTRYNPEINCGPVLLIISSSERVLTETVNNAYTQTCAQSLCGSGPKLRKGMPINAA